MELITEANFEFQFDIDNDKFLSSNILGPPTEFIDTTTKATKTKPTKINRKRKKVSQPKSYDDDKSNQYHHLQLLHLQIGAFPNTRTVDTLPTLVPGCALPSWEDLDFDELTTYIQSQPTPATPITHTPSTPSPKKLKTSSETKVKLKCQAKTQWGAPCTHFAKVGTKACGLLEHKAQLGEK